MASPQNNLGTLFVNIIGQSTSNKCLFLFSYAILLRGSNTSKVGPKDRVEVFTTIIRV